MLFLEEFIRSMHFTLHSNKPLFLGFARQRELRSLDSRREGDKTVKLRSPQLLGERDLIPRLALRQRSLGRAGDEGGCRCSLFAPAPVVFF